MNRCPTSPRLRSNRQAGMTLIEVVIVLAIVGLMGGIATVSYRAIGRAELRGTASKLSGAIRYLYSRSISTGQYYRLVFDFEANTYKAEKSDSRFLLQRSKDRDAEAAEERVKEQEEEDKRVEEEERGRQTSPQERQLMPPPRPKRARFQSFQDALLPTVELKSGVRIKDVYTPRQEEAFSEGRAYLYFFPDGRTERAVIHLVRGDEEDEDDVEYYTLIVHPLSGRVEVKSGQIEVPNDFDYTDDEGNREVGQ